MVSGGSVYARLQVQQRKRVSSIYRKVQDLLRANSSTEFSVTGIYQIGTCLNCNDDANITNLESWTECVLLVSVNLYVICDIGFKAVGSDLDRVSTERDALESISAARITGRILRSTCLVISDGDRSSRNEAIEEARAAVRASRRGAVRSIRTNSSREVSFVRARTCLPGMKWGARSSSGVLPSVISHCRAVARG